MNMDHPFLEANNENNNIHNNSNSSHNITAHNPNDDDDDGNNNNNNSNGESGIRNSINNIDNDGNNNYMNSQHQTTVVPSLLIAVADNWVDSLRNPLGFLPKMNSQTFIFYPNPSKRNPDFLWLYLDGSFSKIPLPHMTLSADCMVWYQSLRVLCTDQRIYIFTPIKPKHGYEDMGSAIPTHYDVHVANLIASSINLISWDHLPSIPCRGWPEALYIDSWHGDTFVWTKPENGSKKWVLWVQKDEINTIWEQINPIPQRHHMIFNKPPNYLEVISHFHESDESYVKECLYKRYELTHYAMENKPNRWALAADIFVTDILVLQDQPQMTTFFAFTFPPLTLRKAEVGCKGSKVKTNVNDWEAFCSKWSPCMEKNEDSEVHDRTVMRLMADVFEDIGEDGYDGSVIQWEEIFDLPVEDSGIDSWCVAKRGTVFVYGFVGEQSYKRDVGGSGERERKIGLNMEGRFPKGNYQLDNVQLLAIAKNGLETPTPLLASSLPQYCVDEL